MKLTQKTLTAAIVTANEQYKARKGERANLNEKTGMNPDLEAAQKIVARMTDAQVAEIIALEVSARVVAGLQDASNTKKPMRILQALLFTMTQDGRYLKGSARTFILEFCGLVIGGAKTRDALAFAATGKGNESTSDEISIAKARNIQRAFGKIGVSTEQTQNSVSFSKGGICDTLGIARKSSRSGMPEVDLTSKLAQKLNETIAGMTDGKLALIVAQSSERAN